MGPSHGKTHLHRTPPHRLELRGAFEDPSRGEDQKYIQNFIKKTTKGRDHLGSQGLNRRRIILKLNMTFGRGLDTADSRYEPVTTGSSDDVMNVLVPYKAGNFLGC
jgi:hypothetical protein